MSTTLEQAKRDVFQQKEKVGIQLNQIAQTETLSSDDQHVVRMMVQFLDWIFTDSLTERQLNSYRRLLVTIENDLSRVSQGSTNLKQVHAFFGNEITARLEHGGQPIEAASLRQLRSTPANLS